MHGGGRVCDGGKRVTGPGGGKEGCSGWDLVRSGLLLDLPFEFLHGLLLGLLFNLLSVPGADCVGSASPVPVVVMPSSRPPRGLSGAASILVALVILVVVALLGGGKLHFFSLQSLGWPRPCNHKRSSPSCRQDKSCGGVCLGQLCWLLPKGS